MKHIINSLKERGLYKTAEGIQKELKASEIKAQVIKQNVPKLKAFANKISATKDPELVSHSKKILEIISKY